MCLAHARHSRTGSPTARKWREKCEKMEGTLPFSRRQPPQAPSARETNAKRRPPPTNPSMGKRGGSSRRATATAPRASSTAAGPDASGPATDGSNPVCCLLRCTILLVLSIRDLPLANVCVFLRLQGATTTGGRKQKAAAAPRKPRKAQVQVRVRGFVFNCSPHSS